MEQSGCCEVPDGFEHYNTATTGDYSFKTPTDDDSEKDTAKLATVFSNGRLAMVASMATIFEAGLTGSARGTWAAYSQSPLRASRVSPASGPLAIR